ncbi:MAG: BrnA antitoxin family protein [Melioribacteraceae bacterium]
MSKVYTDLTKLMQVKDLEIDYSDIQETDEEFWNDAKLFLPSKKMHVSIRLDEDIISFFKKFGRGYQTRINAVLRSYVNNSISK